MITTWQRHAGLSLAGWVLAAWGLATTPAGAKDASKEAPEAVKAAIEKSFPGATIQKLGREREEGVQYFEVDLRQGNQEFSAEVSAEGTIGEVETEVAAKDLPEAVTAKIKELAAGAEIKSAEKHEVRGVPLYGTFAALAEPVIVYEVKYRAPGAKHNAQAVLRANGSVVRAARGDDDDDDDESEGDD
jgi:hypothetical protein